MGVRLSIATIAFLFLAHAAQAERLPVRVYSTAEGLPHPTIYKIVRDSRGFIWFCTREGLSRFDGYEFTNYSVDDGLPGGNVLDILESPQSVYWLATSEGLARFDPAAAVATDASPRGSSRRQMFTTYRLDDDVRSANVFELARDANGVLWVGTGAGLYRLETHGTDVRIAAVDLGVPDRLLDRKVQSLLVDRHGDLWIANGYGIFLRSGDGRSRLVASAQQLSVGTVGALIESRDGRVLAGTNNGLWVFRRTDSHPPTVVRHYGLKDGLSTFWIRELFEAANGALWVGTVRGVLRAAGDGNDGTLRFQSYTAEHGFPEKETFSIIEDTNGSLWIGTAGGAAKLSPAGLSTFGIEDGIAWASGIVARPTGEIVLVGGHAGEWGLYCFAGQRLHRASRSLRVTHTWGWNQVLLENRNRHWWLASASGVQEFPRVGSCTEFARTQPRTVLSTANGLPARVVIRLFEDLNGDLWIATVGHAAAPDGLSRWTPATGVMRHFGTSHGLPNFERHFVSAFAEDSAGNVWIGFSGDGGLARFRDGKFQRFTKADGVPGGQIRNMTVDAKGRLWAASYRHGLCRIDNPADARPVFRTYTTADGLAGNETHAVVSDSFGRIYVGTARSLDRFDPETGLVKHYTASDGVPEGEMHAAVRDSQGVLWFTYSSGLLRLIPQREVASSAPVVLITGVQAGGRPRPVSPLGEVDVTTMEFPSGSTSLQIDFVALGFGPGQGLRYQYRLDGVDADWSRPTEHRRIVYGNLGAGDYRFHVRAQSADGVFSSKPATFGFVILPPVWQRAWFVASAALLVALAGFALYRYRVSRLLEIARLRSRIATDLHDDIGANLTRIAVLGAVAQHEGGRSDGPVASMTRIARESVATMKDIVWAIDPARDRAGDLVRKMREHAGELFSAGDVVLAFTAPADLDERRLGADVRRDVFLIFKEATNNAARHAACGRVDVDVRFEDGCLMVRVLDDGLGFDPPTAREGHGMLSMRRRAERLGGTLSVDSAPGRGTRVTLTLPLERRRMRRHPAHSSRWRSARSM